MRYTGSKTTTSSSPAELESLLDYLKRSRGFDFTGYRRPSLARQKQAVCGCVGRNKEAVELVLDTLLVMDEVPKETMEKE